MKLKKGVRSRILKANPTPGDVHVNAPLTNISVAYLQDSDAFIADKVFPMLPVSMQSNLYYIFNASDFNRDQARRRAPGTESAGSGFRVSTGNYACLVDAFHKDIDDQMRANADSVLSLDRATTELVTNVMAIRRELQWATSFFTTGVWDTDITPGTLWSAAGSKPKADVQTGVRKIQKNGYRKPNTLVLGPEVADALTNHADVRDQFKYTSAESIDLDMLARFFNIDRVMVMEGVYDAGPEGGTTAPTFIGGKNALLCYAAPSPSLMTPTAGYTFAWTGFTGGVNGMRIKRLRADLLGSDRVEGEQALDQRVVSSALGYFFSAVVA